MREIDGGGASTDGARGVLSEDSDAGSTKAEGVSTEVDGTPVGAGGGMPVRTDGDPHELDGRKEIWPETQSIDGLCRVSQLYPRTIEQAESRGVTYNSTVVESPDGKSSSR